MDVISTVAQASQPVPGRGNVGVESFTPAFRTDKDVRGAANQEDLEKEILRDVLKRTGELLSIGDRGLKFVLVEDADVYQLQVIDMTDGRVVRKVPPDEILRLITHFRDQLVCDYVDVMA